MTEQREQQAAGAAPGRPSGTSTGSAPLGDDRTRPLPGYDDGPTVPQERGGGWQGGTGAPPPPAAAGRPESRPTGSPDAGGSPGAAGTPDTSTRPDTATAASGGRPTVPRAAPRPGDRAPRPATAGRQRRARLRVQRIDPWSVFVLALLVSLFLAVVLVVAVVALYAVLEAAGVPDSINALVAEVTRSPGGAEPEPLLSAGRALTTAGVVAVVDVVLLTALATLSAVLYNLCAAFTGGLEVTLAEHDG